MFSGQALYMKRIRFRVQGLGFRVSGLGYRMLPFFLLLSFNKGTIHF